MTIAVILAIPDGLTIRDTGDYARIDLRDKRFQPIVDALQAGESAGVFAVQLHGLEHYWPVALMKSSDPTVRDWLLQEEFPFTEQLPPPLQSRWVDASELPSLPLPLPALENAVEEEAALFRECFGEPAKVAVPTTFIWDDNVEAAWAKQGIEIVITPGRRNSCRDEQGLPGCGRGVIHNLERGNGVVYLVRDDYFEPEKGHTAATALAALRRKKAQGRPCLLETHRANFLGVGTASALAELDRLLALALAEFPDIRFMSSSELAAAMADSRNPLLARSFPSRIRYWLERVRDLSRFNKLAELIGFLPLLRFLVRLPATGSREVNP
ncbi:MAG TPA: hypothetical protein EYP90_11115 [Chromatiaceae bacterium]|nr:hypothetical protein [Chromatiaceae bacterium]